MRIALAAFLISSFIGISVFGVFGMNRANGHDHGSGCIAATIQRTDCPKEGGVFSFIAFHLDAFRSFSTATFGNNLASALLLLIASALTAALGIFARINPAPQALATNYHRRQFLESLSFPFQRKLTHWLALHENSPTTS